MADRPALIRQWLLLRALCASRSGRLVRDLAEEFSVSEKSIRRDLDALNAAGFRPEEITEDRGRKRWRIDHDPSLPLPELDISETAALYLGRRLLEPLAGTTLWEAAQSAFVKLRQQFSPDALKYLESLAGTLHETTFGQSDYSERADVIDALMLGVNESRVTRLLYHPLRSETPEEYELQPLGLIFNHRTLYLVAASADRPELRHFKVDRIRDVELLPEPFTRPPDFDLQQHLEHSLGVYQSNAPLTEVRIRFSSEVARYVTEHRWHHSQQIETQPDGSLIVTLRLGDLTEVKSWVLGFGAEARVLAPPDLVNTIRDEIDALRDAYANSSPIQEDSSHA
ncbi:WYL domain-containing protein [bacterium]|nr:WYL domain-containing protein [bacterium]